MKVHCQNCGKNFPDRQATTTGPHETICPKCGATMIVTPVRQRERRSWWQRWREREEQPTADGKYRRVYNPIPRPALYAAGIALALLLLSPFWVYLIQEQYKPAPILLSEETTNIVISSQTSTAAPIFTPSDSAPVLLDQFQGVRLEADRDDLLHRFNLRLQTTRGMEPEIYLAQKVAGLEQLTAYFFGGVLKEAILVLPEQRQPPDVVLQRLTEQFGTPVSAADSAHRAALPGIGTPGIGGMAAGNDLARKLSSYPWRRDVVWADDRYRVEATIYYSSADPSLCQSLPVVHLSAAAWLKEHQPIRDVITPTKSTPGGLVAPPTSLF